MNPHATAIFRMLQSLTNVACHAVARLMKKQ
jgi:hypothetical protein